MILAKCSIFQIKSGRNFQNLHGETHNYAYIKKSYVCKTVNCTQWVYLFGTFFCLFCFSQTSQTSKKYSFGHLSGKLRISNASKSSASKAGKASEITCFHHPVMFVCCATSPESFTETQHLAFDTNSQKSRVLLDSCFRKLLCLQISEFRRFQSPKRIRRTISFV